MVGLSLFFTEIVYLCYAKAVYLVQCSNLPGTGQKVCGGVVVVVWWWCGGGGLGLL